MELHFQNPGVDYMIDRILDFQTEESSPFWSAPLYHFYPQLDQSHASALPLAQRRSYIGQTIRQVYMHEESRIHEKIAQYQAHWSLCKPQIVSALSEVFDTDCKTLFPNLICNVSMNPIQPRFLEKQHFDLFYLNSPQGAIGSAIHEIIHFVWFHVWNQVFADSYQEYESPSMKWILSEMVVEPIMRDSRLSSINPYFPLEHGGCVYPYFYTMVIDGCCILDTLYQMLRSMDITAFMKTAYAYCQAHETQIRQHIQQSEQ